jgi:hypothetical protein
MNCANTGRKGGSKTHRRRLWRNDFLDRCATASLLASEAGSGCRRKVLLNQDFSKSGG